MMNRADRGQRKRMRRGWRPGAVCQVLFSDNANPGDRGNTSPVPAVPHLRVAFAGRAKIQPPEP